MALKLKTNRKTKAQKNADAVLAAHPPVKKLRVKSTAPVVAPTQTPGWDVVDTSTEQTAKTEVSTVSGTSDVTVMLPFKRESGKYLEVVIGGNQAWLARDSVTVIEQKDDAVYVRMTRAYARRRGLLLDQIAA